MRTTLILRDDLMRRAAELTGIKGKTELVHRGVELLIAREAGLRLARLGGSDRAARGAFRRRSNRSV